MTRLPSRDEIQGAGAELSRLGLTQGTSGNLSVRSDAGFWVTATGSRLPTLSSSSLVEVSLDGTRLEGDTTPSSEWRLHAAIYRSREDVNAVVHTHSAFATTVACMRRDIPPVHYMIAITGGDSIRCAPYEPFGTEALALAATSALDGRLACLLAHHGQVAAGATMRQAVDVAVEVEFLAGLYWRLLQAGDPITLSHAAIGDALERFKTYRGRF